MLHVSSRYNNRYKVVMYEKDPTEITQIYQIIMNINQMKGQA